MVDDQAYRIVCDYATRLKVELDSLKAKLDSVVMHCADLINQNTKLQDIAAKTEAENERLGKWIDNYKREQESIIGDRMAERDVLAADTTPEREVILPDNWFNREGNYYGDGAPFTYCNAEGPERAHCVRAMHTEGDHEWAWFTREQRARAANTTPESVAPQAPRIRTVEMKKY